MLSDWRSSRIAGAVRRSEEHTSELQSQSNLVCRLLLEKKKKNKLLLSTNITPIVIKTRPWFTDRNLLPVASDSQRTSPTCPHTTPSLRTPSTNPDSTTS